MQFSMRSALADTPEKRLLFAVLMDAVSQLQRGDVQGVFDTEHWIRDESEGVPLRFTDVCEALDIEPQGLAAALMSLPVRPVLVPRSRRRVTPFGVLASKGGRPRVPMWSPGAIGSR